MALVEDSLSTTTLQDWQPVAAQQNTAITRLCQQSNWALSSGGAWQWQHGSRIVNTGTILSGATFWPVVCFPFGGTALRVSVYGKCSSGGSDQIGIYLSDSWPFGAGVQVGTLTIPGTAGVATATIDTQVYFDPVLIYLKAETNIDDLELQGFRGRLVGAEPDGTALNFPLGFGGSRYLQEKEFADASPLTWMLPNTAMDVAYSTKTLRGRGHLHYSPMGGSVRNAEELTYATLGASQVLTTNLPCKIGPVVRAYVRTYQLTNDGDDSLVWIVNGTETSQALEGTGLQTQEAYEGWQYLDLDGGAVFGTSSVSLLYASDNSADSGHVVQDISLISGLLP